MIDLFKTSVEEVFSRNFGWTAEQCDTLPETTGYMAQIPFSDGERQFFAEIWVDRPTLTKIANILLFEENPDEETFRDLTSELANFIVGHVKMEASDRNLPYRISTPEFLGIQTLPKQGDTLLYKIDGRCIAIQVKENDG